MTHPWESLRCSRTPQVSNHDTRGNGEADYGRNKIAGPKTAYRTSLFRTPWKSSRANSTRSSAKIPSGRTSGPPINKTHRSKFGQIWPWVRQTTLVRFPPILAWIRPISADVSLTCAWFSPHLARRRPIWAWIRPTSFSDPLGVPAGKLETDVAKGKHSVFVVRCMGGSAWVVRGFAAWVCSEHRST